MTAPYLARLACLCFAAFFLAHGAAAAIVSLLAKAAVARATRMSPPVAARLLFWLRLAPAFSAAFLILGLCLPSYFLFEPKQTREQIGPACLIAAALAVVICAAGLLRGVRAAILSAMYLRNRHESSAPALMLVGVFRPRLIVSPGLPAVLNSAEFEAALRHELAHGRAKDNLKRLLILLSPETFPFSRAFQLLENARRRLAEWAADDSAAEGSPEKALALAAALVRVGRMRAGSNHMVLGTSLLADTGDLSTRVNRLMNERKAYGPLPRVLVWSLALITVAIVASIPSMLHTVHQVMEVLAQ